MEIKELKRVPANELVPNPKNWRTHPTEQVDALKGVLSQVGWADAVLVRETPDGLQLLDGHARAEIAPDQIIPVLVLDVTEEESDQILATHEPIAAMAGRNQENLDALIDSMSPKSQAVQDMLAELRSQQDAFDIDTIDFPALPDGEERGMRTMTFSLTGEQQTIVDE